MKRGHFNQLLKSVRQMGKMMKGKKLAGMKVEVSKSSGLEDKITREKIIYEHNGWKFHEVSPKLSREIDKRAKAVESGKVKAIRWKGSFDKTFGEKA